jgi:hypothetical protein
MAQHELELVRLVDRMRFSTWLAAQPWHRRWFASWPALWASYRLRG